MKRIETSVEVEEDKMQGQIACCCRTEVLASYWHGPEGGLPRGSILTVH